MVNETQRSLDEVPCPDGWSKQFVAPPWAHLTGKDSCCRSCGTKEIDVPARATLLLGDRSSGILYFSFALVCLPCVHDDARMRALSDRAFAKHLTGDAKSPENALC